MNKNNIEELIPLAIECIKKSDIYDKENDTISKEFNGYISNLGASIVQSGLKNAIVFFEDEESNTNEDRYKIPKLVLDVLKNSKKELKDNDEAEYNKLSEYVNKNNKNLDIIKEDILNALIALKHGIRIFKLREPVENKENKNSRREKKNNEFDMLPSSVAYDNCNIGYLYYRELANDVIDKSDIETINKNSIGDLLGMLYKKIPKIQRLYLKTTYPGLLVGSGNNHCIDVNKSDYVFKLGLEFDYTTGQPIINGSSIKGVLKNAFEIDKDFIIEKLNSEEFNKKIDENKYKELIDEIFEGKYKEENIPMKERDVFFDAFIVGMDSSKNTKVLGEDYITPHNKSMLKNPIPIRFLKVMPEVVWCFSFKLNDSSHYKEDKEKEFSSQEKLKLFKDILEEFGVGAKTNLGYGTLLKVSDLEAGKIDEKLKEEVPVLNNIKTNPQNKAAGKKNKRNNKEHKKGKKR